MIRTIILNFFTVMILVLTSTSCKSSLSHAKESLQGTWHVKSIFSNKQDKSGPYRDGQHKESGDLGTFTFSEKEVSFNYTRLGVKYKGASPWTLSSKRVPQSFVSVIRFTLLMNDKEAYEVRFGDRTSNSEKNARQIQLYPANPSYHQSPYYILRLIKK